MPGVGGTTAVSHLHLFNGLSRRIDRLPLLRDRLWSLEGNLLEPMVQQRAVDLPPALLLFAVVAGGLVFGVVGIFFAAPLTVVLYVLVKRLYVQEALHTATPLPGETEG